MCLIESVTGCGSKVEVIKGEMYKNSIARFDREVIKRLTIDGEEYVVTRDTDDGRVRIMTANLLRQMGWELKSEQEETVVSIEEIARKFGVDTDKLRIKE